LTENNHIVFSKVTFGFKEETVFNNFSFEAKAGRHTVIKGESGSGKSTLLKLLLGFYLPFSGTITIQNSTWTPQTIRQQTAWLPQDLNLGNDTVQNILEKPFKFRANHHKSIPSFKISKTLQTLGLTARILNKQFRDLSTGQRQRVGLALCHLLDKPLLLLDEPTSALDTESKQKAANRLLDHNHKTIISTSHDPFWTNKADNIIEIS
jgi:ABC-type bacteriocin/lantibiotic exporter with double-glycine peptidase domain